ncbi:hypothetical protein JXB28_05910 [Candidatus Woesearchaeota archaeon]|nr:hypothetical protein [Candidatus Woesearchaeota archaeon]
MAKHIILGIRGISMNKRIILAILCTVLALSLSQLASAIIFNVTAARQEEWDRYLEYREDYIKINDLEGYEQYIYEPNLVKSFGFRPASYYYVSPQVLQAKYNPPLQGEAYYTDTRGYTSSLYQPSAVKYYADYEGGRYTGYVDNNLGGTYFDHPQAYQSYGVLTYNYPSYNYYNNNHYNNYYSSYGSNYGYNNYGYGYNDYGYTSYSSFGSYGYPSYSNYGYGYGSYNSYGAYARDVYSDEPAYYARISEPLSGGYYVVGFY